MKTLGKLKLKEKMLSHEELLSFRGGMMGSGTDCAGYGDNKCKDDCPCKAAEDHCVNGLCKTRD